MSAESVILVQGIMFMSQERAQPADLITAIGAILRMERESRKLTQGQLAAASGVARRTISLVEKGETDKLTHATKLAWTMGIRMAQVFSKAEAIVLPDEGLADWKVDFPSE